jgi:hypothetical protein
MLRLYLRALTAETPEAISAVADQLRLVYIDRQKLICRDPERRAARANRDLLEWLLTPLESMVIPRLFTKTPIPFTIGRATLLTWTVPTTSSFFRPAARLRWLADFTATCFPADYYLSSYLHFPPKVANSILVGILSFIQTWHINRTTGQSCLSVSGLFITCAAVFAVHVLAAYARNSFYDIFPPMAAHCLVPFMGIASAAVIQNLAEEGLGELLMKAADEVLFFDADATSDDALPTSVPCPDSLACAICKGLVSDPVVALGFVFCGECLRTWFRSVGNMTHPITAEILSADDIWRSGAHRKLARNYFEAVSKKSGIK